MHSEAAKSLGITDGKIAAVSYWQTSIEFSDKERAALAMTIVSPILKTKGCQMTYTAPSMNFSASKKSPS
ncbi:hypothetical protein ND16A_1034 [Thalassotalea sp. ND16A]|nr:hypothetical protein ND16A_1034 [Thalassotalea sp. ND16A]